VVVPTYRRDDLLERCLQRLIRQDLPAKAYEVLIVDDAAGRTVPVLVGHLAKDTHVRLVALAGKSVGPAAARNTGWRRARGEIIAFIDDDAYPNRDDWLRQGLIPFADPAVAAVTGTVSVPSDDPPTDFQLNVKNLENARFLTCNAFVRRSVLEAVDGFDERFRVAYREDSDLQFRIEAAGGRIVRNPAALVIHPAPCGHFGISLRLQRYSFFNALIRKKHPERYRELEAMPPLNYYMMIALIPLAAGAALFGQPLMALTLGGLWAGLYAEFLFRRIRRTSKDPKHLLEMALTSLLIPPLSVYWRLRGALQFRVFFL
jgi:glycosyltransferase involved in cell wall biosynthesis